VRPRRRLAPALTLIALALVAAGATSCYERMGSEYVRYEGVGPGWDSARVVVGGWPLPYLLDHPSLSPRHSVSLTAVLDRTDIVRPWRFLADALLFWVALGLASLAIHRARRAAAPDEALRPPDAVTRDRTQR